ncbi:amino acid adenylation domain-containing protein [Actinokineospora baliensis]|uniref:non-ribosomal peptide synthetase n=1 Tax=Actinokineospora baliensis TaxID=547056 RepID=UPI00195E13CD|nr:non-ribosomal peptide synthetase [Actinokineospora baliensis]MBM7773853.1 amino acid adenylation domain-containing protein [Actinokineospora baliensis]
MLSDADRTAMLARLRQGRDLQVDHIPRRPALVEQLPLSFGQEQLWFIDQLAPGQSTYTIAGTLELTGPLDRQALGRAVDAVVARHEVLRTRLVTDDATGSPVQVVDPAVPVPVPLVDLTALDRDELAARVEAVIGEEAARPFALDRGALLRTTLVRRGPESHCLVIVVHHAVFDGWSFGVFTADLLACYTAEVTGAPHGLAELPVQFADYALWERDRLRGAVADDLVEYWQRTLAGAPALQLPTDRPRPVVQTYDGDVVTIELPAELAAAMRALARGAETTVFTVLMAAFQVLLHRFSGQDDIVVGTVSANRGRPELAPLVGYLVNTLAIRGDLSGDPAFRELLRRTHTTVLGAYSHQDLPFARLVDALRVHRDPSRHPVFQVGLQLADGTGADHEAAGVSVRPSAVTSTAAKFDLLLAAAEHSEGIGVTASFATALFDRASVVRLLGCFRVLLEGIVTDPDRPLSRLPLLTATDRHRELVEWNDTGTEHPDRCLHEVFEARVAATPDAVAVVLGAEEVSYAELDARANRVARRLRELGVGPERLVGICMRRSTDRMAAILGVLKAGGGYVPLDPEYPAARLGFMVEDAHMEVVVTDSASAAAVPGETGHVLDLDGHDLSDVPATAPGYPVDPSSVAYVIYTSGSTGKPKGVVVEHRNAVAFATGEIEHWPLGPGDRVLQFASLNFDVSVLDMFGALLSGACLVLAESQTLLSPPRLAELIRAERITFMCLPPAVLNLIADERFPDLRVVIAGGEAFSSDLVAKWARPGLRFINGYGPTETTVGATMAQCADDGVDPPPIGLPLPNYTAYVLDATMEPVPVGVAGELYIGGKGVTRGYLNRPELTEQRFVRDPFSAVPGARLYRTGDIARRRPDGNLQFLGRADDQVKIRGLRVELGEIESTLAAHPAVAQAVVVVGADRTGDKQLVGYARLATPGAVTPADLRLHMADRLPGFMVPPHLLVLESFPLNANGKVDRSRLPDPAEAGAGTGSTPPRTVVETVLADIYADLLNLPEVGVESSFFDLGGNSLQAMQLITRLRRDLAVDTDVTTIFLSPTVERLAAVLRDQHGLPDSDLDSGAEIAAGTAAAAAGTPLVRLSDGAGTTPLHLVHAIGGTVYAYAPLAAELADDYQVWGVEAAGLRPGEEPIASLADMVERYVERIRAVQPEGPYRVGGWSFGGLVSLCVAEALLARGEQVAFALLLDAPMQVHGEVTQTERELAGFFVADAARTLGPDAGPPPDPTTTPVDDQLAWLAGKLGAVGDPTEATANMTTRFAVYRTHLHTIAGYQPPAVDVDTVIVAAAKSTDAGAEWAEALPGPTHHAVVPGDHYTFLTGRSATAIALTIAAAEQRITTRTAAH